MHTLLRFLFLFLIFFGCNENLVGPVNYSLSGKVVDRYAFPQRPILRAKVFINSSLYAGSSQVDSSGRYSFAGLNPGSYAVKVEADSYTTLDTAVTISGIEPLQANFELAMIYEHEAGTVLAGFQDSITVVLAFQFCSSLGVKLRSTAGFIHRSKLPTDSLPLVRAVLRNKPYLVTTDYTVYSYLDTIRVVGNFHDLDSAAIADWTETQRQLQIVSVVSPSRDGNIQVVMGQETFWVREFRKYPRYVDWLSLNYTVPIVLH